MKYFLLCLLSLHLYYGCHACDCSRSISDKQKEYSAHYIYKFCRTPDEANRKIIDWDSWWRGYLQAHSDMSNFLYLKNKDSQYE